MTSLWGVFGCGYGLCGILKQVQHDKIAVVVCGVTSKFPPKSG